MGNEENMPDSLPVRSLKLLDLLIARTAGQYREGQHNMVRLVAKAIESQEHLLVQAGTGTGKSLAYLIPAFEYAAANRHSPQRKPVLIATATLALQAQIMERDIPRLLSVTAADSADTVHHGEGSGVLDEEFSLAVKLFKGRANYICKYKVFGGYGLEEEEQGGFPGEEPARLTKIGEEVARLHEWAEETKTGDRDELKPGASDAAWRQVSVTSQECLNRKCPMLQECFSETARAEAAEADIIVTNHALLALDTFGDHQVLPDYGVVIIDEAHELQDRVTSAVTEELSARMIYSAAQSLRKNTDADVDSMMNVGDNLTSMLGQLGNGLLPQGFDEHQLGIIGQVFNACKAAYSDSKAASASGADGAVNAVRTRVAQIRDTAERILGSSEGEDVVWIRRASSSRKFYRDAEEDLSLPATVIIAPLSVAAALRSNLFGECPVILTSATLAIGDSFDPIAAQIGLPEQGRYTAHDVGSPFDYRRQGILYVAKHLEKPSQGISLQQLQELHTLVAAAQGGALGLFSSHQAAQAAAAYMRDNSDHSILLQGESTLAGLVDDFADDWEACLFGTMSLWQGVDVPGLSCRLVVIDRIPFPRPDDPLIQAKARAAEKNGFNGFMSISAAYAATKLAQGTGRLIRAADDKGVVAVLDSRLVTARYGGFLKKSLPPLWPTTDQQLVCQALARLGDQSQEESLSGAVPHD